MKKYRQLISSPLIGDCYRACMATLLQLPPEVLPNDFSPAHGRIWGVFLEQFGLGLSYDNRADQPIWLSSPWIASVKSLNYEGVTHAILMHGGGIVLHDPSNKKKYKTGEHLHSDKVLSGQHLLVVDAGLLHRLKDYRDSITKSNIIIIPNKKARLKK